MIILCFPLLYNPFYVNKCYENMIIKYHHYGLYRCMSLLAIISVILEIKIFM